MGFFSSARDAQALFLPAGHVGAALGDFRLVTVRLGGDEILRLGDPGRLLHLPVRHIRVKENLEAACRRGGHLPCCELTERGGTDA